MSLDVTQALAVFGLSEANLTRPALAQAFRRAALIVHPDRGGSAELFVALSRARAVLERHLDASGVEPREPGFAWYSIDPSVLDDELAFLRAVRGAWRQFKADRARQERIEHA